MSGSDCVHALMIALAWSAYFILHSILAALRVKHAIANRWPWLGKWYRLAYNGFASVSALPIIVAMVLYPGPILWAWRGMGAWVAGFLTLAAIIGFIVSLADYDGRAFLGLRRRHSGSRGEADDEPFCLGRFHRWVRHPWYAFGLVLVWTRDMSLAMAVSATVATLYILIGIRLEEAKLLMTYGEVYRRYAARVPALIPSPWKHLSRRDAEALVATARPAINSGALMGADRSKGK